ncbi:UspA domain protein [Gloeothece citriformis PCC 7424]|uniref:Universal stress protein n=1 Tax=Gloeothece citriformis (strain PCC 7424) TaxID=65393 RepID=B7KIA2_GLOC7|nr:universal stress protein [Gloeothece citriformis]ACK73589.1 UspA domain protein [Gloeothece citriformis PCC 7424]
MYQNILVALDNSPTSEEVFHTALMLAKCFNAQLMLLHVLSPEAPDSPINFAPYATSYDIVIVEKYQREWEKFKQDSLDKLKTLAEQANEQGIKTNYAQYYGSPGRLICDQATQSKADLIVMGRRGHSTLNELFLGSVSSYVIHHSHCCIHLVQS